MMNDLYSTRVQAPALYSDPRNGSSELADLKPITGGFVEDGPLVRKTPNNYENSKKRRLLVGPRNNIWVGTLNVRTLRRSKVELANRIIANSIDIMGIQEHRIVHTEKARIEDLHGGVRLITCSAWRNSGGASVGGVGLMVTRRAYESISSITPYGSRLIKVSFSGNPRLTVIVVYSPTEASTPEEAEDFYNNLRDLISSTPPHDLLLVLGDFNAKLGPEIPGFTYNSRTNRNGSLFLDTLEECDLEATNLRFMRKKEKRWTFLSEGTHHKALLDYVLVRKKWRASIKDTRTTNSFNSIGSDHRAVISKIRLSLRKKQQPAKKVLYDFEPLIEDTELRDTFAVSVQNRFEALTNMDGTATEKYQSYTDAVHQTCKEHLKPRPKRKRLDMAKDPRVEAARASVVAAKEQFYLDQNDDTRESLNQAKNKLGLAYTSVEEEDIERQVKRVEETADLGKHRASWNLVNEVTGRSKRSCSKITGATASERLDSWKEYFSGLLGKPPTVPDPNIQIAPVLDHQLQIDDGPFTREELRVARKQLKSGKAAGEDGISPEIVKYVDTDEIILDMCNNALMNKNIPDQWRHQNIMPVPKKGDLTRVENYRGIALSSVISKTLNRLIRNRMTPAFEEILRPEQNGFRPGRSTSSHVLGLRRILEGARAKQITAVLLFVDFRRAFDSLHRGILMKILTAYGVPDRLVDLIDALYQDTVASVITEDGPTEIFQILAGVLQGDTLAPLLFIIAIDYIMRKTLEGVDLGFTIQPRRSRRYPAKKLTDADYADDLALLADTIDGAQVFLARLEESAASVGLHINGSKTKYMTNSIDPDHSGIRASDGQLLEEVDDFVYLGQCKGFRREEGQGLECPE
eukprot:sb/3462005/